jgi:hypothetical protein
VFQRALGALAEALALLVGLPWVLAPGTNRGEVVTLFHGSPWVTCDVVWGVRGDAPLFVKVFLQYLG